MEYTEPMLQSYSKDGVISYSLGAFPTVELIKKRTEDVLCVVLSSRFRLTDELREILEPVRERVIVDDKSIDRVAKKGNVYMVGAFRKRYGDFDRARHVALCSPSDAGNLGTIMRTMLGFGVKNLAIIGEAVDEYDPKTVRASMGAIFSLNIKKYPNWTEYADRHGEHKYLFMLENESVPLPSVKPQSDDYALVFGNEAAGLPSEFKNYGTPVIIRHSSEIDSLNLPQAVGIGLYEMTKKEYNQE